MVHSNQYARLLGGNVKEAGGGVFIVSETKRRVAKAIVKLKYRPVSPGIAHTIIEGIVVNRATYRCVLMYPLMQKWIQ